MTSVGTLMNVPIFASSKVTSRKLQSSPTNSYFTNRNYLGEFEVGVIDESFLDAGVEIENNPMELNKMDFGTVNPAADFPDFSEQRASRAALVGALRRHPNGALEAKFSIP